uniref:(northern house mosquito) hypothetical protein n=1 Tax=Culex pipiens TaxID=7175 RepID=A0A8D8P9Z2_CULPI
MESFIFPIYLTNAMLLKIARKQLFVLRHNNISKIALPNAISNKHHKTSLTTTRSSRHLTCCTHSCLSRATKKSSKENCYFSAISPVSTRLDTINPTSLRTVVKLITDAILPLSNLNTKQQKNSR